MRKIEIEEDVYAHIAKNTRDIGEPASAIRRRLLGLEQGSAKAAMNSTPAHEFASTVNNPNFVMQSSAVDKFLFFLSYAHAEKKASFEKVLAIQGRDRKYFGKSREEIERSGTSTQPRNIPGSPYWVMPNSPTHQKKQMLRDALRLLGYSDAAVVSAVATIR